MKKDHIYRIHFLSQEKVYELYAKEIAQSDLFGFIEVYEFVFNEQNSMLVDPAEEKLKIEFDGVDCSFIPMHSVLRIDRVAKSGVAKIRDIDAKDKVTQFPISYIPKASSED